MVSFLLTLPVFFCYSFGEIRAPYVGYAMVCLSVQISVFESACAGLLTPNQHGDEAVNGTV